MLSSFVYDHKNQLLSLIKNNFYCIFLLQKQYMLLTYFNMILFTKEMDVTPEKYISWLIIKINEKNSI
jgi:hypothetical protein